VTTVVAIMSIFGKKHGISRCANPEQLLIKQKMATFEEKGYKYILNASKQTS
jgi:hypothetical protein